MKEFDRLMKMEHMKALISDAFWYFICIEFKKEQREKYAQHTEFLLDRMAANYVSYTLVEDPDICSDHTKKKFFTHFYNHLSQAVYHCLKTAFPKNRNTIETSVMKRKLLNTFSELFTGVVIYTAKWRHWADQKSSSKQDEEPSSKVSLADLAKKSQAPVKTRRQQECLRYSPLVERYLMTHKYETSNNVKGWKMYLTQNTGASKEVDRKFKMFKQHAEQSMAMVEQMTA